MTDEPKCYATFNDWYKENMQPIFAEVSRILMWEIKHNNADPLLHDYLMVFVKNSRVLFELLSNSTCSYQITMTLRLLMEMSADIHFISKFPENIPIIKERYDKIKPIFFGLTYGEVGAEAKGFRLWRFVDGKKNKEATKTEERIRIAYGENGAVFYQYLNAYSHLNHLGVMYDLYLTQFNNTSARMDYRLTILQSYPDYFRTIVAALGELCDSDKLRRYDCSKMDQIVSGLRLQSRTSDSTTGSCAKCT